MGECGNCGEHVSERYVRVFAPSGLDTVRVCPNCEDKVRTGSEIREYVS
jgi:NAD-dependent SIR2 family protein deacetylase